MILSAMQADLYRRLGFSASPDATVIARLLAFLNETQQEILSVPGMASVRNGEFTFPSVASQAEYGVPQSVASIKSIREQTNDRRLLPMSLDAYRAQYPNPTRVTGTPTHYVDLGFAAVNRQPSDLSAVFVRSSSASDVGTAYLEGYRASGGTGFFSTSQTMTGLTALALSAVTDWAYLTKWYLSVAAVGTVLLEEDAGAGTLLATIEAGQTQARYRKVALVPTPASAVTYYVDGEYDIPNLANATDESILPPRFHRMLVSGALMKEYEKQERWEAHDRKAAQYAADLKALSFYVHQQAVGSPNLRASVAERASQLGGWYPAGT